MALLVNRQYAKLWASGGVSQLGDAIFNTTLVLWVATVLAEDQPWAPLAVSGVLLAMALPALLVAPLAGVFVDRWDFRRTMLVNDAVRTVLVGGMVALPLLGPDTLPVSAQLSIVYGVVLLASVSAQFFNPARFAIMGDVVPRELQPKAASLGQATYALAGIVGPPLAAPLLFTVGVHWALVLNAASFAVSFLLVRAIRIPAELSGAKRSGGNAGVWREFTEGIRFYARSRVLVAILVSAMVVMVGAGSLNALDVFFVQQNLHADAKLFGLIGMAFGLGTIVGALLGGAVAGRLGLTRTYWVCLMLTAVTLVGYARSNHIAVAVAVLAIGSVPIGAVNAVLGPIVLRVTPRELVGRTITVLNPAIQLATIVSIAVASWLASSVLRDLDATVAGVHFGPIDSIFAAAGVLTMVAGVYAMIAMRGADVQPASDPVEPSLEPALD